MEFITRHSLKICIILYLVLGFILIVCKAPMSGLDETCHYSRAIELSHGDIFVCENDDLSQFGGYITTAQKEFMEDSINALWNPETGGYNGLNIFWWDDYKYLKKSTDSVFYSSTNTVPYSPLNYIPYICSAFITNILWVNPAIEYLISKTIGFLFYLLLIIYALIKCKNFRILAIIYILFPPVLISFTSVSADGFLNIVFLLYITNYFIIYNRLKNNELISNFLTFELALLVVLLAFCKIPAVVYLLILISLLYLSYHKAKYNKFKIVMFCSATLSILISIFWLFLIKDVNTGAFFGRNVNTFEQINFIENNFLLFIKILVKSILEYNFMIIFTGLNHSITVCAPFVISIIYFSSLLYIMCHSNKYFYGCKLNIHYSKKDSALYYLVVITVILYIVCVFMCLYLQFSEIGSYAIDGVQPRYFTTTLLLVFATIYYRHLNKSSIDIKKQNNGLKLCIPFFLTLLPLFWMYLVLFFG